MNLIWPTRRFHRLLFKNISYLWQQNVLQINAEMFVILDITVLLNMSRTVLADGHKMNTWQNKEKSN